MAKSKSSRRWLAEHFDDQWVKQAQKSGLRSRSAFKLMEIQKKDRLIRQGQCVVDLGSAPGGWCQVASPLIGDRGKLVALDILPMEPIADVTFIEGDFTEDEALKPSDSNGFFKITLNKNYSGEAYLNSFIAESKKPTPNLPYIPPLYYIHTHFLRPIRLFLCLHLGLFSIPNRI